MLSTGSVCLHIPVLVKVSYSMQITPGVFCGALSLANHKDNVTWLFQLHTVVGVDVGGSFSAADICVVWFCTRGGKTHQQTQHTYILLQGLLRTWPFNGGLISMSAGSSTSLASLLLASLGPVWTSFTFGSAKAAVGAAGAAASVPAPLLGSASCGALSEEVGEAVESSTPATGPVTFPVECCGEDCGKSQAVLLVLPMLVLPSCPPPPAPITCIAPRPAPSRWGHQEFAELIAPSVGMMCGCVICWCVPC